MSGARRSSVVELADRPVSGRRAAVVYAVALLGVLAVARPLTYALWDTANREPGALAVLREHQSPPMAARRPIRPAVVVLLDGLRNDRVEGMPALSKLARQGARATVDLPHPTVSKAFYHAFLTGVPPRGSGVRTNRFDGRARLDSLADRVRSHGGRCAWLLEDLDWLAVMHAEQPSDEVVSSPGALAEPLERALEQVGRDGRWLTVVHVTRIDHAGHEHGADSRQYAEAVAGADEVVARVAEATRERDVVLAVLSDHGHIDPGGHGGAEPIVRRVPMVLRAPGLDGPSERDAPLGVAHIAPTLAAWMGVPPPRSAIAPAASGLRPQRPYPGEPEMARGRAALLDRATAMERARRGQRRLWLVPLWLLLVTGALGATKRAFSGLDRGTLIAPLLWVALVLLAHRLVWDRPLSLSALDGVNRHATRLALTSLVAAALAVIVAVAAGWRSGVERRTRIRRAAAATAWASLSAVTFVVAWMGGAVGPWPSTPLLYYGGVLAPAAMAGACLAAAGALFATAWRADSAPGA